MKILRLDVENLKRIVAVSITPDGNLVEITGRNGQGKQQPVSEPVLSPSGWRKMGELVPGDFVVGSDGRPTKVLAVHPQETRETLAVVMSDGAATRCGPDHLWTVSRWAENSGEKDRETLTLSTRDIMAAGLRRGTGRRWAVPVVDPIQFSEQRDLLPIDPYTLGVILGDGHIEPSGYVTVTSWDSQILDALAACGSYRGEREIGSAFWSRPLRHMGLGGKRSWEKFIPQPYLWASVEERRQLLAGLMDTDGTADESWASFCTTSEILAEHVVHLAHSLGYVCKRRRPRRPTYTYGGEQKLGRLAFHVGIKSREAPFTLDRKLEAWSRSEQRGERWRFIDTIERQADEDSVCIEVEAPDGLYVTNDFILTHNTSTLNAIWWALGGKEALADQPQPIRNGADEGRVSLVLDDLVVTRTFTRPKESGGPAYTTSLTVQGRNGTVVNKPQTTLDSFLGKLTFDPLAFLRMDPDERFDLLRSFVPGVDFDAIERAHKADYEQRTEINRLANRAKTEAAAIVADMGITGERIDTVELIDELERAGLHNADIAERKGNRERAGLEIENHRAAARGLRVRAEELRKQADALDHEADGKVERAKALQTRLEAADPLPDAVDTAALRQSIEDAETVNAKIDARDRRLEKLKEAKGYEQQSAELTAKMEKRQQEAAKAIAKAKIPVDGIAFGEISTRTILLGGVPFEQASDAQQLRASIDIAIAKNPTLKVVLVRDGSLLDHESLKIVAERAAEADVQVWMERVTEGGPGGFVIEDGRLKSAPEPEPKPKRQAKAPAPEKSDV